MVYPRTLPTCYPRIIPGGLPGGTLLTDLVLNPYFTAASVAMSASPRGGAALLALALALVFALAALTPSAAAVPPSDGNCLVASVFAGIEQQYLTNPVQMAFLDGLLYINDEFSMISAIDVDKNTITPVIGKLGASAAKDGLGTSARMSFNVIVGAYKKTKSIYFSDATGVLRRFKASGDFATEWVAGVPHGDEVFVSQDYNVLFKKSEIDGDAAHAKFHLLTGMCIDEDNDIA